MQAFMMGLIMGIPPAEGKELREHQKSPVQLRSMGRKLAHIAGLAVLGSRKKENLCRKVDKALEASLPQSGEGGKDRQVLELTPEVVGSAKKAARTVISVLMSAYKHPQEPKYRRISMASGVFQKVLLPNPAAVEVLRIAGFREKEGDEGYLTLMHRNMAVLACVQDRVEVWNRATKMPEVADDEEEYDEEDVEEDNEKDGEETRVEGASMVKLQITLNGGEGPAVNVEMRPDATLGDLFTYMGESQASEELILTTVFPKRVYSVGDASTLESSLLDLGLAPSARLVATDATTLAKQKSGLGGDEGDEEARQNIVMKEKMRNLIKQRRDKRRGPKKSASLFGVNDGIIEHKTGKHAEYFGGDSTVTVAAEEEEEQE
ncbi:unnamed protein product, partial [Discosporangium mesarthrocarpum]